MNTTKLKFISPEGFISIKPWASNLKDKEHLQDAKVAYAGAINSGYKIELYN